MNTKLMRYFFTLICIALIGLSLYLNPDVIKVKTYEEITSDKPPIYTGFINIWQISSWRVAQSSKTLMLLDAAAEFEKRNKRLYIQVEIMSYEDYVRKTSQGKYPDVLSFPAEMQVDFQSCVPIESSAKLNPIHQKAYEASSLKCIPWLSTSNVVMMNSKYADKEKCNTEKFQSIDQIAESIDKLSKNETSVFGSPIAMLPLAIGNSSIETTPIFKTEYSSWLSFARKECKILYGCVWQNYAMDRLIAKEKGFATESIYPHVDSDVFYWTQNFCVHSKHENKNKLIFEYIDLVLSDNWQIKIADSTASFPVTPVELQYNDVRSEIAKSKQGKVAIIPGLGINDYEILNALSGDSHAKLLLKEKLVFH